MVRNREAACCYSVTFHSFSSTVFLSSWLPFSFLPFSLFDFQNLTDRRSRISSVVDQDPTDDRHLRLHLPSAYLACTTLLFVVVMCIGRVAASGCATLASTGWATAVGWKVDAANSSWCCGQVGVVCNATAPVTGLPLVTSLKLSGLSLTGVFGSFFLLLIKL
jgi:hypothetical protein